MLFNSYGFIFLFLPLVLLGYFGLCHWRQNRAALAFLTAASALFYGWWNFPYLLLIGLLVLGNFFFAWWLHRHRSRWLLAVGIVGNLLVLAYFKYANFFVDNMNSAFQLGWTWTHVLLPLGLSFHTFQQIEYQVSVYRGLKPERDLVRYSVFVLFFPQLVAGPLVLYREISWQFDRKRLYTFRLSNLSAGLAMFTVGLAKKVLIADSLALIASPIFQSAGEGAVISTAIAWKAAIAYGLQIYFDFSGYSDMALGLARMFGIRLPANFYSPYRATSIIDFWRRWHMTLSRFLRDYVYIPLGGNRGGSVGRYANLMITMLVGGLWHGASWNFVIWGGLHGLFLIVNHLWRALPLRFSPPRPLGAIAGGALTFLAVAVAWVFFRAPDFATAARMIEVMAVPQGANFARVAWEGSSLIILLALAIVWFCPNLQQLMGLSFAGLALYRKPGISPVKWRPNVIWGMGMGLLFVTSLFAISRASEFIYFNF